MSRFAHSVLMYQFYVLMVLGGFCKDRGHNKFCRRELAHVTASMMTWLIRLGYDADLKQAIADYGWEASWDRFPDWHWSGIADRLGVLQIIWEKFLLAHSDDAFDNEVSYIGPGDIPVTRSVLQIVGHVINHNPHHWGKILAHLREHSQEVPEIPLHLTWSS